MSKAEDKEIGRELERLETLIQGIERLADPAARDHARELVQAVLDFHGAAVSRLLERLAAIGETGRVFIESLAGDELLSSLLLLYGLHPLGLESRVQNALERVRPYLRSHGGGVELLGISEDVVRLRMQGSCHGCPSSAMTLKLAIEAAIYAAAPDVAGIEVEGVVAPAPGAIVQIKPMGPNPEPERSAGRGANGWEDIEGLASLADGVLRRMDVAGRPVLVGRVAGTLYAYGPTCPGCGEELGERSLKTNELVCSACDRRFDLLHAGRGIDEAVLHLDPFPLLVESGRVRIALPA